MRTEAPDVLQGRLGSLDALRGLAMLWIIGGGQIVNAILSSIGGLRMAYVRRLLEPVAWDGIHLGDVFFPTLVFALGAAIPYSLARRTSRGDGRMRLHVHVAVRVTILALIGMAIRGDLLAHLRHPWPPVYSPLQLSALGYLVASLLVLHLSPRWQIAATLGLLLLAWALQALVPVPGHAIGVYQPGVIFGDWLDDRLLGPGHDATQPGWIFSGMTVAATAMLVALAGTFLRGPQSGWAKCFWLIAGSLGCLVAGLVWSRWFPMIPSRWTSSLVLYVCGGCGLLLAVLYAAIDVLRVRRWAVPLLVIGVNPIVAYTAWELFRSVFRQAAAIFTQAKFYAGSWQEPLEWAVALGLVWAILFWMYRKGTFVRV